MKNKAAAIALMALCTVLAIRWLWIFWTPRCNESCASQTVLGMYGLLAAAALATVAVIALLVLGRWTARRGLVCYVMALVLFTACALALTP